MTKKIMSQHLKKIMAHFEINLTTIVEFAAKSSNSDEFKTKISDYLKSEDLTNAPTQAKENICRLVEYDDREVFELSTGKIIKSPTLSRLWTILHNNEACIDDTAFLMDIYQQLLRLYKDPIKIPTEEKVKQWASRWKSGLDKEVIAIREANKHRIISHLIHRIEQRHSPKSRFLFAEGMTMEDKHQRVEEWWKDSKFHLALAARSPKALNDMLGGSLSAEKIDIYRRAQQKGIPIFVTPYYLSLLDITGNGYDDQTIRQQIMYTNNLVETFGNIKAWEKEDSVEDGKPNAAGWLLPEGNNIHRRYPDVAILIPDSMGRACGGLCSYCQRMYDFQSGRLNFDFDKLKPNEKWEHKLRRLMKYFEEDTQLRDILITGGDALMSSNTTLRNILQAVIVMARNKKHANMKRHEGKKYAEIQRVRLGTRLPVYLPMRIDDELIDILTNFRIHAMSVGVKQFFIQTHFQSPLEITPEVSKAIKQIHATGWTVTNQLVFNVGASRRGHTTKLRKGLNSLGVKPYYTFSVKGFQENHDVFTPNCRSMQECIEEKTSTPQCSSDRNVLNLPGIGKSMTFRLVGIMPDGCRLLEFNHDHTRHHSPLIEKYDRVYIKENKSVYEYLNQLEELGENPNIYSSIWEYSEGETEERHPQFLYPDLGYKMTEKYSNIEMEEKLCN